MAKIVALVIGLGLAAGCGDGTLGGGGGPDGSAPNNAACSTLDQCACYAAGDRCQMRTEACWCADVCGAPIDCICGGGQFLGCEAKAATTAMACSTELAQVQQACAAQPFVNSISHLCSEPNATCIGSCLANLASCSEIDCRFCELCDCAPPERANAFAACIESCGSLR